MTFDLTDPGFEALYRHLTDQPATPRPDLGALTILPPKPRPRPSPSPLSSILSLPLPKNRVLLEALYNETTEFLSFTDHYVDDFELLRRLLKDDGKGRIALAPFRDRKNSSVDTPSVSLRNESHCPINRLSTSQSIRACWSSYTRRSRLRAFRQAVLKSRRCDDKQRRSLPSRLLQDMCGDSKVLYSMS